MRILVVTQYFMPEQFRINDIVETLSNQGHNITVLTGLPNYPKGKIFSGYLNFRKLNQIVNGVKIIRVFNFGRGKNSISLILNYLSFMFFGSMKALFLKDDFDVIFVNQLSPILSAIPGIILKKRFNKNVLLYCLDLWPESLKIIGLKDKSIIFRLMMKISKIIYKSSNIICITSNNFKSYLTSNFGIEESKIFYLPQYAEDIFLNLTNHNNNFEGDKIYNFVFAGNIGAYQSVETIINAANLLKNNKNIEFNIYGDGSKLQECKNLAMEYKLKNVYFHGQRDLKEMPGFYKNADALILTLSNNKEICETIPGKFQTYLASAKPILASVDGEVFRIINEANCGFCCHAEDYLGLSKIIQDYISSENKKIFSINSYKYYIENYGKESFFKNLNHLLEETGK